MTFDEVLDQVRELLQQRGRVTYRSLKLRFQLDDEMLAGVSEELIEAERVAADDNGKVLVWTGGDEAAAVPSDTLSLAPTSPVKSLKLEAERRHLTVMFCDLVSSTALSEQLDPEELGEVVRAYQQTSATVIERYEGYVAQYLGDGILVYFGYPTAHEDDAARAVRAGLEIISALQRPSSPSPFQGEGRGEGSGTKPSLDSPHPRPLRGRRPLPKGARELKVRIGIHTGPVVIGTMGGGERQEQLALGETPNTAARVQGQAEPDTVVVSATTYQLINGLFACEDQGPQTLKGISTPLSLYRVTEERAVQSRFEATVQKGVEGLSALVGREEEIQFLHERWQRSCTGEGQAVLVSGEPGIGKSRLMQELKERVAKDTAVCIEFHCSPYHTNSALHPVIEHLQQRLQFGRDDTEETKLEKLHHAFASNRFAKTDPLSLSLLAALLSLPQPANSPPLSYSPQKQKEKTYETLVRWLVEEAEDTAVCCLWEDLHWADPSTLELLALYLDQVPAARMLAMLVFRPEFAPPWTIRSHMTQFTLSRLGQPHVVAMIERVTDGKALPNELVQQIAAKTDGVPLFVEELTKTVLESDLVRAVNQHYELTGSASALSIPVTLQDSLMARLDRLPLAKGVAQLGATVGREFNYELLRATELLAEEKLQQGLEQLVQAELVYQRGYPPDAQYTFKHALIQDTAYESLLKRTRQEYHHQLAEVMEQQFAEQVSAQPELLAHHYTEAQLIEQALPYWLQAGQQATQEFATIEAIQHLNRGVALLNTLPDSPEWAHHELPFHLALHAPLLATSGWASPDLGRSMERAYALCQQVGETPELFGVLMGLCMVHMGGPSRLQTSWEITEQMLRVAQAQDDATLVQRAQFFMANTLFYMGDLSSTQTHLEQGLGLEAAVRDGFTEQMGVDIGVALRIYAAFTLWLQGFPEQALERSTEAVTRAQEREHPFNSAMGRELAALLHILRREVQPTMKNTEAAKILSTEQGSPFYLAWGSIHQGWVLGKQGHPEQGITLLEQGLSHYRAAGQGGWVPFYLGLLAQGHGQAGHVEKGLSILAEAQEMSTQRGEVWSEAELYRLTGELTLQKFKARPEQSRRIQSSEFNGEEEAEAHFHKAIEIAQKQEAKSWELRTATSLARLWQQQGKKQEAHDLLTPVYNWFTEGFDTADLKDAKTLLDRL